MSIDVDKLMKALDNDANEGIMNLTSEKLIEMNLKILQELALDKETTLDMLKKLKEYKYIDSLCELRNGAFLRWIPLTNPEDIYLTNGAILCDIKMTDNGTQLVCKTFSKKHISLKMDENLIFQKLSGQELIILTALDHLDEDTSEEDEDISKADENISEEEHE
jgi:hypothetical protein